MPQALRTLASRFFPAAFTETTDAQKWAGYDEMFSSISQGQGSELGDTFSGFKNDGKKGLWTVRSSTPNSDEGPGRRRVEEISTTYTFPQALAQLAHHELNLMYAATSTLSQPLSSDTPNNIREASERLKLVTDSVRGALAAQVESPKHVLSILRGMTPEEFKSAVDHLRGNKAPGKDDPMVASLIRLKTLVDKAKGPTTVPVAGLFCDTQ